MAIYMGHTNQATHDREGLSEAVCKGEDVQCRNGPTAVLLSKEQPSGNILKSKNAIIGSHDLQRDELRCWDQFEVGELVKLS